MNGVHLASCHEEFHGPRSDIVNQVALETTTTELVGEEQEERFNNDIKDMESGGQLDGWKWDCRRLMLLDASMCLVVLFSDFGINTNPKILCPEDLFQADHELQHLQKTVFSSFGTKEKNRRKEVHYCAAARCRPLSSIRKKNLRYYGAKSSHNAGLYARRPVVCVPLNGRQRRNRLCWAREHVSWTQQQWASVLFTDESRFTMESDSGRLLIWREQRTRYHQSNTVERHSYRGGGILVWAGISLGGKTDSMCSMEEP
ncbi:HTH_Tnp_Tc3_2 domain-containing protein [Trichonephila clavipes]|nr:HTH_Tnp_Tc3_2 domain-containing protein [Trichonephila clavipes]